MREDRLTLLYWGRIDSTRMCIEIIGYLYPSGSKCLLINITNSLSNTLSQVDFGLSKGKRY